MDENGGGLPPDEGIVYYTRPHWMSLLPTAAGSLAGMIAVFLMLRSVSLGPEVVIVLKVAVVTLLGINTYRYWVFQNTAIVVTNRRIMVRTNQGFQTTSSEFLLAKAETMGVQQPFLGASLGYGTLTLSGTGGAKEVFPYVTNPQDLRRSLQEQITAASAPPAAAPAAGERHLGPVA